MRSLTFDCGGNHATFGDERHRSDTERPPDKVASITLDGDDESSWGEFLTWEQLLALNAWTTELIREVSSGTKALHAADARHEGAGVVPVTGFRGAYRAVCPTCDWHGLIQPAWDDAITDVVAHERKHLSDAAEHRTHR